MSLCQVYFTVWNNAPYFVIYTTISHIVSAHQCVDIFNVSSIHALQSTLSSRSSCDYSSQVFFCNDGNNIVNLKSSIKTVSALLDEKYHLAIMFIKNVSFRDQMYFDIIFHNIQFPYKK